ncbi:MAG: hypothetical protein AAF918_16030 [Pseudomonadota bacterium]
MKTGLVWALSGFIAFVFVQSTFFKFTGAEETVIIFNTLSDWLQTIGAPGAIVDAARDLGAYSVGTLELIAAALVLIPRQRLFGASLSLVVISGALFAHLFTPLGIDRIVDPAGNTDGGALFFTAIAVWVSSALVLGLQHRPRPVEPAHSVGAVAA